MRKLLLGVAFAFAASAAFAADDPMVNTYTNTVKVTNAKGEISQIKFEEDKSYTTTTADGMSVKGTWEMAADQSQICYTQTDPVPAADVKQPACAPFLGKRDVGETWKQVGTTGEEVTVELVAGR